jgi:uncharacterized protein (TIGR03066 family)
MVRVLLTVTTVAVGSAAAHAEEKTDLKKQLVGKWEVTKAAPNSLEVGTVIEYTADGKFTMSAKLDGKEMKFNGTYTIEKDGFVFKMKFMDMEISEKITIKKISDTELESADKDGKTVTFKKVK